MAASQQVVSEAPLAGPRRGRWASLTREERLGYRLLLPPLTLLVVIVTYPFLLAVLQSVQNRTGAFVGLDNYARALSAPGLASAITATGAYGAIVLPAEILGGLALALLVERSVRSTLLRAILYAIAIIPIVIPPVALGVIAWLLYAPGYGALSHILQNVGLIQREILWLSTPVGAMFAVASVDIWQWTPFVYLVLFAGLQTVPRESVEAAQVDGATGWDRFWHIELPYVRPLLLLVVFFRLADVLRVFDHVFVLTGGGPGSTTQFLSLYLYRIAFKFSDASQAAALAVLLMIAMTFVYTIITRFLPVERD